MNYKLLIRYTLFFKALRIFKKKEKIELTRDEILILLAIYMEDKPNFIATDILKRLKKFNAGKNNNVVINLALKKFEKMGLLEAKIKQGRGANIQYLYTIKPELVLLLNKFENIYRRTRHDR